MVTLPALNDSDFSLLWDRIKTAFSYEEGGLIIRAESFEVISGIFKCRFIVVENEIESEFFVTLNLSGFFKKRKKKGFVYIGRLDTPIFKDSSGSLWIDGKNEFKSFDLCSKRLKAWLSFILGRQANSEDYMRYVSSSCSSDRDLNPFDFVFEDVYVVFVRELCANCFSLRNNFIYYFKRYKKIDENVLQRYAKKLFKGRFKEFSPVVEQDYVNWLDAIDNKRRIFFLNRKGERIRVNSPYLSGIVYDPIGTSEGALINQKNKLPDNAEIVGSEFYVVYNENERITLYDFFSKPVLMLSGKVMQWGVEVNKTPELRQDQGMVLSTTSLSIPMINFCDTTRAILSGHMMLQAVPLVYGAPSIIHTGFDVDLNRFFNTNFSKMQYIPSKKGTYNFIESGIPDSFNVDADTQRLSLKLSFPLLTAYMNFWGLEQEDAIVISESAAEKLSVYKVKSETLYSFPSTIPVDVVDVEIYCSSDSFNKIPRGMKKYYRGNGNKVILKRKYVYPVQVGDKITTRYGCKGVVSKIVPDNDMPYMEDGRRVQVIQSPLAVLSRKNIAQYYEALFTNALYLGTKLYDEKHRSLDNLNCISWEDRHRDLGIARMILNPIDNRVNTGFLKSLLNLCEAKESYYLSINGNRIKNPVVVGYNEFFRLYFFSEKKLFYNYVHSGNHPGFRVDEMSLWALMSYNKVSVINSEDDRNRRNEWINSRLMMSGYMIDNE